MRHINSLHKLTGLVLLVVALLSAGLPASRTAAQEDDPQNAVSDALFVEFAPMTVAVIRDKRIQGHLTITMFLAVGTPAGVNRVETLRPKLRDAVLRNLARVGNARVDPHMPVDLKLVADYLQLAVDDVLGDGVAKVLLQSASTQIM